MVASCLICQNSSDFEDLNIFRFPLIDQRSKLHKKLSKERQKAWIKAINRSDLKESEYKNTIICSKHFISGNCAHLLDRKNPDWIPSLHLHCPSKLYKKDNFLLKNAKIKMKRQRKSKYNIFKDDKQGFLEGKCSSDVNVKIVNEPIRDEGDFNSSETESVIIEDDFDNRNASRSTLENSFDGDMDMEQETVQLASTIFNESDEDSEVIDKLKLEDASILKTNFNENSIQETEQNLDDGVLIETDCITVAHRTRTSNKGGSKSRLSRKNLNKAAIRILKKWLYDHRYNPYPTDTEKNILSKTTQLNTIQISNWFINARRRVLRSFFLKEEIEKGGDLPYVIKRHKKFGKKNAILEEQLPIKSIKIEKEEDATIELDKPIKSVTNLSLKAEKTRKECETVPKTKREIIYATNEDGTRYVIGHKIVHVITGKVIKLEIYNKKNLNDRSGIANKVLESKSQIMTNPSKKQHKKQQIAAENKEISDFIQTCGEEKDPLQIDPEDVKLLKKPGEKTETPKECEKVNQYLIVRKTESKANNMPAKPSLSVTNNEIKNKVIISKSLASTTTSNGGSGIVKKPIVISKKQIEFQQKQIEFQKKQIEFQQKQIQFKNISSTNENETSKIKIKKENIKLLNMNFKNIKTPSKTSSSDYPLKSHYPSKDIIKGICSKEKRSKCLFMLVDVSQNNNSDAEDSDDYNEEMVEEVLENEFEYQCHY